MNTIKTTISQRKELLDRNNRHYLILELDNGQSVFVFSGKVNETRWDELKEGREIKFIAEEGKNGAKVLVDYELK